MTDLKVQFDNNKTFPLVDGTQNCNHLLDNIIYKDFEEKEFVEKFYNEVIKNSFLKKQTTPSWFINKTVFEENYQNIKNFKLNKADQLYFNTHGLDIYLSEPLNFYKNKFNKNKLLSYLDSFAKINNLKSVKIFTCEKNSNILNEFFKNLSFYCKDIFCILIAIKINKENSLILNFENKKEKITKKFWCGNVCYNQHRHYIISYLIHRSGNFSWNFNYDLKNDNTYCPSFLNNFNEGEIGFLEFLKEFNCKMHNILLKNNKQIIRSAPYILDNKTFSGEKSIENFYNECFCAVVTETYYYSRFPNISEKTLYAIAYGKPFILVAPPDTLNYLKELGFKTFDSIWNEDYDKETDPKRRMAKIFQLIDEIDKKNIDELKEIYQKISPILDHNCKILKNFSYNNIVLT